MSQNSQLNLSKKMAGAFVKLKKLKGPGGAKMPSVGLKKTAAPAKDTMC